jgi:hypothetical protein
MAEADSPVTNDHQPVLQLIDARLRPGIDAMSHEVGMSASPAEQGGRDEQWDEQWDERWAERP